MRAARPGARSGGGRRAPSPSFPAPLPIPPRVRRYRLSLLELPLLAAHGAVLLDLLRVQPLEDAVHVEAVRALPPHQRAVVSGNLACGTDTPSGPARPGPGPPRPPARPPARRSQSGQQPLKAIRQIPQFSSLATHSQEATPCQLRTRTRIPPRRKSRTRPAGPARRARGRRAFAAGPPPSASGVGAARPEVQAPERSRHHGRQDGHVPGRYH